MKSKQRIGLIIIVILIVAGLVGIFVKLNHKSMPISRDSTGISTNQVAIQGYTFMPESIEVKVGTVVTWTNKDNVEHTVTADTASKDAPSSDNIDPGQTYSFKFAKVGTFTYHCAVHPYMHGTVQVVE